MIATAHIAAGAVAALVSERVPAHTMGRAAVAAALGFFSHFILDMVPHSDYAPLSQSLSVRVALAEALLATVLVAIAAWRRMPPGLPLSLIAGIGASALPDTKSVVWLVFPPERAAALASIGYRWHEGVHAPAPFSLAVGWGAEIVTALLLLGVLLSARRRR